MIALIVDDEYMLADYLKDLIKKHCEEIKKVEIITNAKEAIDYLNRQEVDVLFLDIKMPELSGFDLIEKLPKARVPSIIFTTAYENFAVEAFNLSAVHYLLKPIDPVKLKEAVDRLSKKESNKVLQELSTMFTEKKNHLNTISLANGQEYNIVEIRSILRVEGAGSYSTFILKDGEKIMTSKRLNIYDQQLSSNGFIRVHQSHLINHSAIKKYVKTDGGYLELTNGDIVPVGKKMKFTIKRVLGL